MVTRHGNWNFFLRLSQVTTLLKAAKCHTAQNVSIIIIIGIMSLVQVVPKHVDLTRVSGM